MKKFLAAIDQGTTSSRAILFSLSGKPIYPGINCLPTESEDKIRSAVQCAMENGAEGAILSWDYCLTPFKNMLTAKTELLKN